MLFGVPSDGHSGVILDTANQEKRCSIRLWEVLSLQVAPNCLTHLLTVF